jgi:type II secretory pathway pseudopilin PulG
MKNNRGDKGFLLLELVVGIAILAVGITMVIQAFSVSARAHALSRDLTEAVFLIEDKFQEMQFRESRGLVGTQPPEVTGTRGKFEWKYTFAPVEDTGLYLCNLSVAWKSARRSERLDANTYFSARVP